MTGSALSYTVYYDPCVISQPSLGKEMGTGLGIFVPYLFFSLTRVCFHPLGTFRRLRQLIQQLLCRYNRPPETEGAVQVRDSESLGVP